MEPRAVLLLHLLYRPNLPAKCSKLGKFLLDCLQPFEPLAASELSVAFARISKAIQGFDVSDLTAETRDLLPKNV